MVLISQASSNDIIIVLTSLTQFKSLNIDDHSKVVTVVFYDYNHDQDSLEILIGFQSSTLKMFTTEIDDDDDQNAFVTSIRCIYEATGGLLSKSYREVLLTCMNESNNWDSSMVSGIWMSSTKHVVLLINQQLNNISDTLKAEMNQIPQTYYTWRSSTAASSKKAEKYRSMKSIDWINYANTKKIKMNRFESYLLNSSIFLEELERLKSSYKET